MLQVEVLQVFEVLLLQQPVALLVLLLPFRAYAPPLSSQNHGRLLDVKLGVLGPEFGLLALSEQEVRGDRRLGDLVFVLLGER